MASPSYSIATRSAGTASGPGFFASIVAFFETVQAAGRVSGAVRNRQKPEAEDLAILGLAENAFDHL